MVCSRDRYRLLAVILGGLLTLSVGLMIAMMPLKQYFYRLLTINQQTGEVVTLKELEQNTFTANWVVTHYFINQYIQNRHTYHYEDIKQRFNATLSMSSPKLADTYEADIIDKNPQSPINVLGKDGYRDVTVLSINPLNSNTALVRFKTVTRDKERTIEAKTENYQAIVKWDYHNSKASLQERDLNPLGFRVTYYQVTSVYSDN